jgi:hypothetical protein
LELCSPNQREQAFLQQQRDIMRSHQALQTTPLIEFEDLSLAMFSQLKFAAFNKTLDVIAEAFNPGLQMPSSTSPRLQFMDELSHSDH